IRAYSRHLAVHRDHISQPPLPRLVIAGPGLGTPFGRKIEQLVQTSCPPGSIHFTGMLEGEAKSAAIHGCEAFILPSHQENFGIAVVEALACSKPVLISNQVNIHSRISEAGAGLVAGDDLAGVEDLLAGWLALGAKERGTMGAAASDLFKREFSSPQAAVRMITTITSLLAP
ncbi:MAG: glycosyltransferase, partial [bacterium]